MKSLNFVLISLIIILSCNNPEAEVRHDNLESNKELGPQIDTSNILLARFCKNNKWGYFDTSLKVAIEPIFDKAYDFHEGLARVRKGEDDWGYINIKGEYIIKPQFKECSDFHDGLAYVVYLREWPKKYYKRRCYYYINQKGEKPVKMDLWFATEFNNGSATVIGEKDVDAYIDKYQNQLIERTPKIYDHFKYDKIIADGEDRYWSKYQYDVYGNPLGEEKMHTLRPFVYLDNKGNPLNKSGEYSFLGNFHYTYKTPSQYLSFDSIPIQPDIVKVIIDGSKAGDYSESEQSSATTYKIQFFLSPELKKVSEFTLPDAELFNFYQDGGQYKYTYGNYSSHEEAAKMLPYFKKNGYSTSFIVKFQNGKRVK